MRLKVRPTDIHESARDHFQMTSKGNAKADNPVEIHTLQWLEQNHPISFNSPIRTTGFEIIWIVEGTGKLTVDCQEYVIEPNLIYCLSPGQLRQFSTNGKVEGYYISLSEEFAYLAENKQDFSFLTLQNSFGRNLQIIHITKEIHHELEDILMKMRTELSNCFMLRTEILKGLLKIFIIYLSRKAERQDYVNVPEKDIHIADRFIALLKIHYTTKRMVADYARELCVTPNYLNRIVKKVSGFPASYHIQQHIILEAKRQALYSGLSMKEVAYELGFTDYAHFSKFFKNNSGMNFTAFKNGSH
ncbi:helix-turn-helix domain-containing protein [Cytophagaceae bacterium YF14B1]|uniref:Helix-turn-helix domain-containing protein n=1 Tax=Xanthocytophaga flava TaxID=3048013 RepID=A0AAE3U7Q5_9BACT|nr:helix-turn-helix domain-containing protein [Xanthocytophaga flavus]MDJ1482671.1 helix-turn-helix domain-containing protein [Xanthocytophaga flavus]